MRRKIAIATVTAAALIGTGGAVAFAQDDDPRPSARPSSAQNDGTAGSGKRTAAEAADLAQKAAGGTVTGIQLDDDRQGPVWEVDLARGGDSREVRLDALTGKVFSEEDEEQEDAVPADLKVSAADAARKAATAGTVTSVDIDDDSGDAWEVETTDADGKVLEVRVDAQSGEVTRGASDDGDDRGRDDDHGDDDGRDDDGRDDDYDDHGRHHDGLDDADDRDDDRADDDGVDDDDDDDSGRHGRHHGGDDSDDDGDDDGRHGGSGRH